MLQFFIFLSFFPYFNFAAPFEVVPIGILGVLPFLKIPRKVLLASVVSTITIMIIGLYNSEIIFQFYGVLVIFYLCLACSRCSVSEKPVRAALYIWVVSILLSNLNFFTGWDSLADTLFSRVYVCDFPFSCPRGGSGFSPEPSYAALTLFLIVMLLEGFNTVKRSTGRTNKIPSRNFDVFLIVLSFLMLKTLIGYLFLLLYLGFLFRSRFNLSKVLTIIALSYLAVVMISSNSRLAIFKNFQLSFSPQILASNMAYFGSTREIGVYCGYGQASVFVPDQNLALTRFKSCQYNMFLTSTGRDLDSGFKPYSPFAFVSLYFGLALSSIIALLFVSRIFFKLDPKLYGFVCMFLLLIFFRTPVLYPVVFICIFMLRNFSINVHGFRNLQ